MGVRVIKYLFAVILCLVGVTASAAPKVFTANKDRTIYLVGEVGANALELAAQVQSLAETSRAPIDIVINSPGGSVQAGLQLISSINMAQARGIRFRCIVPVLAASMGFQVLAHCDERYSLKYSMLLFHPMKVFIMMGALSSEDLLYEGRRIRETEEPLVKDLQDILAISPDTFYYHYRHETLWFAYEFRKLSPGFLTIVDDIRNVQAPFNLQ